MKVFLLLFILTVSKNTIANDKFISDRHLSIPQMYKVTDQPFSQSLNIVIVKGRWSLDKILIRFDKLRRIFRTCQVGVTLASVREVEWKYPGKGLFYDLNDQAQDRYFDGAQQLLFDLDIKERPLAIFIDSFDEWMPKLATSFPAVSIEKDAIALNTFWITDLVNKKEYLEKEPDNYSVFAHELGHILLNDTHEVGYESNLMHSSLAMLSDELTDKQCEKIRSNITFSSSKGVEK